MMIYVRSFFANLAFYIVLIASCLIAPISFILPKTVILQIIRFQSIHTKISLKLFANLEVEYRGLENIPKDRKYLIAAKHQSLAEAVFLNHAIDEPTIIAKKQLLFVPVVGLAFKKANFIYVDRRKGETNIIAMVNSAKRSMNKDPRPLLIFPEGTRTPVGERKPYKYGITALYKGLNVPCLPVAINAGYFWSRRRFLKYPGKMVIEFLKPIPPGLELEKFSKLLYDTIEDQSDILLEEAKRDYPK
jgi:1-acyl-sn-glycerol-3-phosphate acyltransferase